MSLERYTRLLMDTSSEFPIHFLKIYRWDEDTMRETYHGLVADEMGDPQGGLMVDESGFVKKGMESVGVARQDCGTLGKVDKSQVGVCAA